jgi:hypothetical protein
MPYLVCQNAAGSYLVWSKCKTGAIIEPLLESSLSFPSRKNIRDYIEITSQATPIGWDKEDRQLYSCKSLQRAEISDQNNFRFEKSNHFDMKELAGLTKAIIEVEADFLHVAQNFTLYHRRFHFLDE